MVRWVFDLDFEKKINIAPNNGSKINDDKIGKSIIYLSIKKVNKAENPNNITNA